MQWVENHVRTLRNPERKSLRVERCDIFIFMYSSNALFDSARGTKQHRIASRLRLHWFVMHTGKLTITWHS